MPVFRLTRANVFPPIDLADPDGLLAVGGDLSPERLLLAYRLGIFPWYSHRMPILWWSPDPRLVLFPHELKITGSLARILRKGTFTVTFDRAFSAVIRECAVVRLERGEETWLSPEMVEAYLHLHRLGHAHSVETWHGRHLVGGLYGVSLGKVFFGESMFTRMSNASKVALVHLVDALKRMNFELIDCQVTTTHLLSLGAREIPRRRFLRLLEQAVSSSDFPVDWSNLGSYTGRNG